MSTTPTEHPRIRAAASRRISTSAVTILVTTLCFILLAAATYAQELEPIFYDIGSPASTPIYVSPTGSDSATGADEGAPLRTLTEAWNRIPNGVVLDRSVRIILLPGEYPASSLPRYFEMRHGTYDHPIIISSTGRGRARLLGGSFNVFDSHYLYLYDLDFLPDTTGDTGGDILHFEACHHLLVRGCRVDGGEYRAHEALKVNQSHHVYIEECNISGADDNAIDMVGVQYGHVHGCTLHHTQGGCIYLKGGSAYFRVEGNEIYDGGEGGFTAGQGTGLQFMQSPWIHYEAYDIKAINNVIHDITGAGLGVGGGYNILMAYNTLYRVGRQSHLLEIGFGSRSCDGTPGEPGRDSCDLFIANGGWGTTRVDDGSNFVRIPSRNVYIYNNIFYNPTGYQTQWQQFFIPGPFTGDEQNGSNVSVPTLADQGLQIRGNIIWNGPADHPLGIGGDQGCADGNPDCNAAQLLADNSINSIEPQLVDPTRGDYHPLRSGNVFASRTVAPPDFPGGDREARPLAPEGNRRNTIPRDRSLGLRSNAGLPGAYDAISSDVRPAAGDHTQKSFQVTPNPATGKIQISWTFTDATAIQLTLLDLMSREISARVISNPASNGSEFLDISSLPSGLYILRITSQETTSNHQLLIIN